jgi:hypothetical protein
LDNPYNLQIIHREQINGSDFGDEVLPHAEPGLYYTKPGVYDVTLTAYNRAV